MSSIMSSVVHKSHKVRVAMATPWDQVCGNAEYAKRLARGLQGVADIIPFELHNFSGRFDKNGDPIKKKHIEKHFEILIQALNESTADIIHIQHEYGFFGRTYTEADKFFNKVVASVNKPVVVTLHTILSTTLRRPSQRRFFRLAEKVLHPLRTYRLRKSLSRVQAIVVHSLYTKQQILSAFPEFKKKVVVALIPISKPTDIVSSNWPKSSEDKWLVIPGFVSSYKGHVYALLALLHLPENYHLVIAGGVHPLDPSSSDYWMSLVSLADKHQLTERVIMTGFIEDELEQAGWFQKADAFILPYKEVGQSGSAALADVMAYQRPVITSRAKSMFAYRFSNNTWKASCALNQTAPRQLAKEILMSFSPEGDKRRLEHHNNAIKQFSPDKIAPIYAEMYSRTLASGH